jgi:iron complex outermembrane receptor protein
LFCFASLADAIAGTEPVPPPASGGATLADLSLDELTQVQFVTSVSKKPEKLADASAAIHVVTGEEIEARGVTSIPEALRDVPGMFVGRVDAHTWAISSRGFNDAFGNKLLVLLDGRSVYTPLFSGVYWDVQDTVLEDLDRIEVVRGPGATMWGANAVNGVINVISKSARETQGTLVSAGGGTEETAFATVRHGGTLGSNGFFRVYLKYNERDDSLLAGTKEPANDGWHVVRGGFRADWEPGLRDQVTLQGDVYRGEEDQSYQNASLTPPTFSSTTTRPTDFFGANLLGRWTRSLANDSEIRLQAYYDHTSRDSSLLCEERDTFDIDGQHRFGLGQRQEITWGAAYRYTQDDLCDDSFTVSFASRHRGDHLLSWFGQDEVTILPDRLSAAAGIKLEHNDYTGFEYQPRGSLHFKPHEKHSWWASVSRAVRTPSRAENDIRINDRVIPGTPPILVSIFGNSRFDSETVLAYETGYRFQPTPRLSADLALFYNEYRHLRTAEPVGGPAPDPSLPGSPFVQRVNLDNKSGGETYGAELSVSFRVLDGWNLRASYSALELQLHGHADTLDANAELDELKAPHHQIQVHSSVQLARHWQFDLMGRYVDGLADFNIQPRFGLDARLAWQPSSRLEISIVGHDLLDDRHPEFWPTILNSQRTEVQRGVFGKVVLRF